MAIRQEDHLRLRLLINGVIQVKTSSIGMEVEDGSQEVLTLEGLAGFTPGAGSVTINVSSAIALGGPEHDVFSAIAAGEYADLQIPLGPKSYIGTGKFRTASVSQSTGANTEVSFSWKGQLSKLR